jgi:tetratricopeptide (TPR) repeat protein
VGTCRFAHALVQETLAGDLSPVHRARLHLRIATVLEEAYPGQVAEIAEHRWAALPVGAVGPALRAQVRAADAAWAGLAHERAEALLERASALAGSAPADQVPPEVDLEIHLQLGSLRTARYGYTPAARASFDRARTLAERLDRHADLLTALLGLSATAVVRGDLDSAEALTAATLEHAGPVPAALVGVGIVDFYRGRLDAARERFAATLAAWDEPAPDVLHGPPASARPDVMAAAYDALAAAVQGDPDGAADRIARALRGADESGEPYLAAFAHSFHARLGAVLGDRALARDAALRAGGIAGGHGFPLLAAHAKVLLGWARAGLGEPAAGLADLDRAVAELDRAGQRVLAPFHLGLQAEVRLDLGEPEKALALLDEALAETAARGGDFWTDRLRDLRSRALADRGVDS